MCGGRWVREGEGIVRLEVLGMVIGVNLVL